MQVKLQGTNGVDYDILVAPHTPVKVRPSKKAKTSTFGNQTTYLNQEDGTHILSYEEPMVVEVTGEDGVEYSIPVSPGTPVKIEKTRNIGKKEKIFYLEKIISGLENPIGTSRAALKVLVDSGVMTAPQYNERKDETFVNLMFRKNGHPEGREGGFRFFIQNSKYFET